MLLAGPTRQDRDERNFVKQISIEIISLHLNIDLHLGRHICHNSMCDGFIENASQMLIFEISSGDEQL